MSTAWITVAAVTGPSCTAVRKLFASPTEKKLVQLFERIERDAADPSVAHLRKHVDAWNLAPPYRQIERLGYSGPKIHFDGGWNAFVLLSRPTRHGLAKHMTKVLRRRASDPESRWLETALHDAAVSTAWLKVDDAILVRAQLLAGSKHDEAYRTAAKRPAPWA